MSDNRDVPGWARWFLRMTVGKDRREEMIGDLDEVHRRRSGPFRWLSTSVDALQIGVTCGVRRLWDGGGGLLTELLQDTRYAARSLRKSLGFTVSILLVLALGIGASTAIFSVVHAVILRPLPYPDAHELVRAWPAVPRQGNLRVPISYLDSEDWKERARTFSHMGTYTNIFADWTLTRDGDSAEEVSTVWVGGDFFGTLGVPPSLGVGIEPDDVDTARAIVVLSDGAWRNLYGSEPDIIGRTITLNFQSFEVVGVMPEGFSFPGVGVDVWVPMTFMSESFRDNRGFGTQFVVGRLAPGTTPETAQAELTGIARDLESTYPDTNAGKSAATVQTLHDTTVEGVRAALWSLLGAVGFFLVLATANVANLLLARGVGRGREIALRKSLGASRQRVIRQLITETVSLALTGTALGLGLAWLLVMGVRTGGANLLPRASTIELDGTALFVALLIALVVTVLSGLLPALRIAGGDPSSATRSGAREVNEGLRGIRLRRLLVAGEVALAVVLLVGAGLLIRSFNAFVRVDPGFGADGAIAMRLTIPQQKYPEAASMMAVYRQISSGIEGLPGVTLVGATADLPFRSRGLGRGIIVPGVNEPGADPVRSVTSFAVSENAFQALGITLLRGRSFMASDGPDDPPVVVVNETMVREFFLGRDPIGRRITGRDGQNGWEVVGVVRDVRHLGPAQDVPAAFYVPLEQQPMPRISFVAVSDGDPLLLVEPMRNVVRSVDSEQPITEFISLDRLASEVPDGSRFLVSVMSGLAMLAVVLAVLGVYGVLAYAVRMRSREMGLRSALGASRGQVIRYVIAGGMRPALVGLAVGLVGAALLSRFLESLLFDVEPLDAAAFASGGIILAVTAAIACTVPAVWAARVDPMVSLRAE